ncbi:MAG TPA: hypothetical protein VGB70_12735 [Allosphingosinicella sp.]|jgi:hypothetical protein
MATTPSRTGIVNLALTRIGTSRRISSLDEASPVAIAAREVFDPALRAVLAAHPWNFACRRVALPAADNAPAFGYARRFPLPGECLRWLPPERDEDTYFEGEEEGGAILTNSDAPLPVRFIALVEDAALWSPEFEQVLAYRIALELALALTALAEVSRLSEEGYLRALSEAKRLDSRRTRRPERNTGNDGFTWLDGYR